jgi:hypothetical protein
MGKRTDFARRERDDYPTPFAAVVPLLRLLEPRTQFVEPCAGAGELVQHLERAGHICVGAFDLPTDARTTSYTTGADTIFISNPPWRTRFEPDRILVNLSEQRPTWLLLYSDWLFTSRATPYLARLRAVVVVGRVKWIPNSPHAGFENCCWCLFGRQHSSSGPAWVDIHFAGRIVSNASTAHVNWEATQ